jgi:hypothetical protein
MRSSLVQAKSLPQPIRKRPYQEGNRAAPYWADPSILERGEAPFAALKRGNEGLDRVALRRGFSFARHHRPAYRVHHSNIWTQEPHILDLPYKARPLHPPIKELLVKRADLLTPFKALAVERNEISIFRENGGEAFAAAPIPAVHQLLVQATDGCLVGSRVRGVAAVVGSDSHWLASSSLRELS